MIETATVLSLVLGQVVPGAVLVLVLALLWRLLRRQRVLEADRLALARELEVWRGTAVSMGRRLERLEHDGGASRRRVGSDGSAAASPQAHGKVVPLRVPEWVPAGASDEELALAAGMMRGEAHLANRLRQLAERADALPVEHSGRRQPTRSQSSRRPR